MQLSDEEKLSILEADIANLDSTGRGKGYIMLNQFLSQEYINRKNYTAAEQSALNGLEHALLRNDLGFVMDFQNDLVLAKVASDFFVRNHHTR